MDAPRANALIDRRSLQEKVCRTLLLFFLLFLLLLLLLLFLDSSSLRDLLLLDLLLDVFCQLRLSRWTLTQYFAQKDLATSAKIINYQPFEVNARSEERPSPRFAGNYLASIVSLRFTTRHFSNFSLYNAAVQFSRSWLRLAFTWRLHFHASLNEENERSTKKAARETNGRTDDNNYADFERSCHSRRYFSRRVSAKLHPSARRTAPEIASGPPNRHRRNTLSFPEWKKKKKKKKNWLKRRSRVFFFFFFFSMELPFELKSDSRRQSTGR